MIIPTNSGMPPALIGTYFCNMINTRLCSRTRQVKHGHEASDASANKLIISDAASSHSVDVQGALLLFVRQQTRAFTIDQAQSAAARLWAAAASPSATAVAKK